jgi:hypothetical protein
LLRKIEALLEGLKSISRASLSDALGDGLDVAGLNAAIQGLEARGLLRRGPGQGGTILLAEPPTETQLEATLLALQERGGSASSQALNAWAEGPGGVGREAVGRALRALEAMGQVESVGRGWTAA